MKNNKKNHILTVIETLQYENCPTVHIIYLVLVLLMITIIKCSQMYPLFHNQIFIITKNTLSNSNTIIDYALFIHRKT